MFSNGWTCICKENIGASCKAKGDFTSRGKGSISWPAILENPPSHSRTHSLTQSLTHSHETPFDKSTIEQVYIRLCKQSLTVPWYRENIACRAELGRHPLSMEKHHSSANGKDWSIPLTTFCYEKQFNRQQKVHLSSTFNKMKKINKKCKVNESVTQQHIKNARLFIKKTLRDQNLHNWLENQNSSSTSSREKFTPKEVTNDHQLETTWH